MTFKMGDRVKIVVDGESYSGRIGFITKVDGETWPFFVHVDNKYVGMYKAEELQLIEETADFAGVAPDSEDLINQPKHYTSHPSGVEVIQITEHMGFCLGNVIKYVLRADHKGSPIEDLEKAAWYLNREIDKRKAAQ